MIDFIHAYKTYGSGTIALRDVTLEVGKGEFVFLTGPSGAGKTTLFRLLSAYDQPTSGQVVVCGFSIGEINKRDVPALRRKIGVVYQDFRLLKDRTVFENVALPLEIRGDSSASIQRRTREVLDQVSLLDKLRDYPSQLSGGEQQRVAIARALSHQPAVLIADEPTGNLDPDLAVDIMALFDKVNAQGTTVFIATHDHDLVRSKNRRTIEINHGVVVRA